MKEDSIKEYMIRRINEKLLDMMESDKHYSPAQLRDMMEIYKDLEDAAPDTTNSRLLTSDDFNIINRYVYCNLSKWGLKHTAKSRAKFKELGVADGEE